MNENQTATIGNSHDIFPLFLRIAKAVRTELLKRGFNVELEPEAEIALEFRTFKQNWSAKFQTTPVLFKEVELFVRIEVDKDLGENAVSVQVKVQYEKFSGGHNGLLLFTMWGDATSDGHLIGAAVGI